MLITTKGIIFRTIKYSESSIIGDIYTKEKGLRSFIISGIRSKKSKTKIGLIQPGNIVEVVLYDKEQDALCRVKEIRPDYIYKNLPFNIGRSSLAILFLEFCRKSIKEYEANPILYKFLKDWFVFIDQSDKSLASVHLLFLLELSSQLGFGPSDLWSDKNKYFDLQEGVFLPDVPAHSFYLDAEQSNYLHQLFHFDKHHIHSLQIPKKNRIILLYKLIDFYALQVANFGEIKSLEILQEIFQ